MSRLRPALLLLFLSSTAPLFPSSFAIDPAYAICNTALAPSGHILRIASGYLALALAYAFGLVITIIFGLLSQRLSVDDTYFGEEFPNQVKRIFNALGSTYLILAAIRVAGGSPDFRIWGYSVHEPFSVIVIGILLLRIMLGAFKRYWSAKNHLNAVLGAGRVRHRSFLSTLMTPATGLFANSPHISSVYQDFSFAIGFLPRTLLLTAFVSELLCFDPATILALGAFLISGTFTWVTAIKLGAACSGPGTPKAWHLVCKAFLSWKTMALYITVFGLGYVLLLIAPFLFDIPAFGPGGERAHFPGALPIVGSGLLVLAAFLVGFGSLSLSQRIPQLLIVTVTVGDAADQLANLEALIKEGRQEIERLCEILALFREDLAEALKDTMSRRPLSASQ